MKKTVLFAATLFTIGSMFAPRLSQAAPGGNNILQEYLETGRIAEGRQAVEVALKKDPQDDGLRFQLAVAQLLSGVERLSQDWYRYGLHNSPLGQMVPFLRLPVPLNPHPERITDKKARQILQDFIVQLGKVSVTLSAIKDDSTMKVPLKIGLVRLDLDGDGKATDEETLWKIYARLNPVRQVTPEQAKAFVISFDAGDARWLEGYCHLLSALGEMVLAYDTSQLFSHTAQLFFTDPDTPYDFLRSPAGEPRGRFQFGDIADAVAFVHLFNFPLKEPHRMQVALSHLQQVTTLSRRSWKDIMAEKDDDNEWIPSPTQTGVLPGSKVTQEMVDGWLKFLDESDSMLAGKTLAPFWRGTPGQGVNLRRVFTEPTPFDLVLWVQGTGAAPYLEKGTATDPEFWRMINRVFRGEFLHFAIWFN